MLRCRESTRAADSQPVAATRTGRAPVTAGLQQCLMCDMQMIGYQTLQGLSVVVQAPPMKVYRLDARSGFEGLCKALSRLVNKEM